MAYAHAIVITNLVNIIYLYSQLNVSLNELPLTKPQISMRIPTLLQEYVTEQSEWQETAVNTCLGPTQDLKRGQSKWGSLKFHLSIYI